MKAAFIKKLGDIVIRDIAPPPAGIDDKTCTEFIFPKVDPFYEEVAAFVDNCGNGIKSIPGAEKEIRPISSLTSARKLSGP